MNLLRPRTRTLAVVATLSLASSFMFGSASAAPGGVDLGTATSFAILAGAGITNTGTTVVRGDVGSHPTTSQTGTGSIALTGVNHGGDALTQGAKSDLDIAYNAAAGLGPGTPIVSDLGGQTLVPGVYTAGSSIGLTGALTLDGEGREDSVFVFQAGSTLTTASGSSVVLINGAQACNVFWQVGSSATLGTGSSFRGSILALSDITVAFGTSVDGRVLARNGAVTLDTNNISRSECATASAPAPTDPAPTTPVEPAPSTPVDPAPTTPVEPAPSTPVDPTPTTPVEPAPSTPVEPAPSMPGEPTPAPIDPITPPSPDEPAPAPLVPSPGPDPIAPQPDAEGAGNPLPGTPAPIALLPVVSNPLGASPFFPGADAPLAPFQAPLVEQPQVPVVPRGGVAAGDGSGSNENMPALLLSLLGLGLGGTGLVLVSGRRVR